MGLPLGHHLALGTCRLSPSPPLALAWLQASAELQDNAIGLYDAALTRYPLSDLQASRLLRPARLRAGGLLA